jgi:hydrogenase 3 maturation protease
MSYNNSWKDSLKQTLTRLKQEREAPRLVILGIGHELRGDDGVGTAVVRHLSTHRALTQRDDLLILNGAHAPENQTGPIRRFSPDFVLLIDAALLDEAPGAVRWLPWEKTVGLSASSHTLPPYMLAHYLTVELGCQVALLGIQPLDTSLGVPLSPIAQQAVDDVCQGIASLLA